MTDLQYVGICPVDANQMVERTWYSHECGPVLHTKDRSDGEENWFLFQWDDAGVLEPWNNDVSAARGQGVRITNPRKGH